MKRGARRERFETLSTLIMISVSKDSNIPHHKCGTSYVCVGLGDHLDLISIGRIKTVSNKYEPHTTDEQTQGSVEEKSNVQKWLSDW
jgi:hypothetical protein